MSERLCVVCHRMHDVDNACEDCLEAREPAPPAAPLCAECGRPESEHWKDHPQWCPAGVQRLNNKNDRPTAWTPSAGVQPSANYIAEVHPQPPYPSCHVCGSEMVPDGYKCLPCGANTKPSAGVHPPAPLCWHKETNEEGICKACGAKARIRLPIHKSESSDLLRLPNETSSQAEKVAWIEWIEPFGPDNEPVYMRVTPETAIDVIKKAHPELTDDQALDEFIVVNWASKVTESAGVQPSAPTAAEHFNDGCDHYRDKIVELERQLEEARQALDWITKTFKRHLAGTTVRDVDEAISRAERVLGEKP